MYNDTISRESQRNFESAVVGVRDALALASMRVAALHHRSPGTLDEVRDAMVALADAFDVLELAAVALNPPVMDAEPAPDIEVAAIPEPKPHRRK